MEIGGKVKSMSGVVVDPTVSVEKNEPSSTLSPHEVVALAQNEYISSIPASLIGLHLPVLIRVCIQASDILIVGDERFICDTLPTVRFAKLRVPGRINVLTEGVTPAIYAALHTDSYVPVSVITRVGDINSKYGVVLVQDGQTGITPVQTLMKATHYVIVLGQQANRSAAEPVRGDYDVMAESVKWLTGWSSTVNNGISVFCENLNLANRLKKMPDLFPGEKAATGIYINGLAEKYKRLQELELELRKQGAMPGIHS